MQTTTLTFPSHDGSSIVHATLWEPDDAARPDFRPRAIVQIVHGMQEHVGRYEGFAAFLVDRGFVVCGDDHVGHGRTGAGTGKLGHMSSHGGASVLVEDVHALRGIVSERYPGVAYAIFGHSMGSFVTRVYLTRHGEGVAAAVLCGTGQPPRVQSVGGAAFARAIATARGEEHVSALAHRLGEGGYGVQVGGSGLDWLATDPAVVRAFEADPLCGAPFTVGSYAVLASLVAVATDTRLARRVPRDLPMLFVSGEGDPVGSFGRGVRAAAGQYRRAGVRRVDVRLYPGVRHEILQEGASRGQVMEDVLDFLGECGL